MKHSYMKQSQLNKLNRRYKRINTLKTVLSFLVLFIFLSGLAVKMLSDLVENLI